MEKQTWELVSEGPVPGPSPDDPAVLIERTETLQVPEMARLLLTIVLNAKGDVVSVSIAAQQPGTFLDNQSPTSSVSCGLGRALIRTKVEVMEVVTEVGSRIELLHVDPFYRTHFI